MVQKGEIWGLGVSHRDILYINLTVTNASLRKMGWGVEESRSGGVSEDGGAKRAESRTQWGRRGLIKDGVEMAEWRKEGDEGWVVAAVFIQASRSSDCVRVGLSMWGRLETRSFDVLRVPLTQTHLHKYPPPLDERCTVCARVVMS